MYPVAHWVSWITGNQKTTCTTCRVPQHTQQVGLFSGGPHSRFTTSQLCYGCM